MSFFAVLLALLLEQVKPLPRDNWVHELMTRWMAWCGRSFDAGTPLHARIVWVVSVLGPTLLCVGLHLLLAHFSFLLALAFSVLVLYLTLGFRQFSHYFTDIRQALERGEEDDARTLLTQWLHLDASELPRTELLRHVIEHALLAAHRHVFGVFFWFVVLAAAGLGPAGAVFYRMAEFASRYWAFRNRRLGVVVHEQLCALSLRLFALIDHVPARLTAFGFAVVGNFEDAVAGWRRDAALWAHANEGIILAAAAGAEGIRLGGEAAPGVTPDRSQTLNSSGAATAAFGYTPGDEPQLGHLGRVAGLVWRSMVLWMLLLALLKIANLLG
ncbi:MAG: CobD/CbiB family protein [Proteobacteria bacterium]|nr:CobD/CbiB family protein [Pseudomonadota bacterium]